MVGIAATRDGRGYWLVASNGGVFSFGDARFHGSLAGRHLRAGVVGIAATQDGRGYWLVAADGGVFSFGDARFHGSLVGRTGAVAGISGTGSGGYWLVSASGTATEFSRHSAPTTTSSTMFGVLDADPQFLSADAAAGIRLATMDIGWDQWEPEQGSFDSAYISQMAADVAEYLSAGWKVGIDVGLQSPPSWALGLPYGQLVDQNGDTSGTPDYEFSEAVRAAATTYIENVVSSLTGVSYYRIGLSASGEMLYPDAPDNQWWAFSPLAQGAASGLAPGVGVTPMPGWVPGTTTWDGSPVTQAMVQSWYDWYLGALINAHTWEIDSFRQAGYQGLLQYVMPGTGALPSLYQERIAGDLAATPDDSYSTLNTGAVWWDVLPQLPLTGAVVDISSVGDGSGDPQDNVCQASDSSVDYQSQPSAISSWSATRWLTYLAGLNHLPVMGENPGDVSPTELPAIMSLVQGCHLTALQWAWDYQLNESSPYVSLSEYAQAIATRS
jgi:hypothetical protein